MNHILVSTLFFLQVATFFGTEGINRLEAFRECKTQHGYTKEMIEKLRLEHPDKPYKPEDVPKEYLCVMKCMDEKTGIIKDGKLNIEAIRKDVYGWNDFKFPEKYLKCLEEIDEIKTCEDFKKNMKCDYDVGHTHLRYCSAKLQMEEQNKSEKSGYPRLCHEKCIMESRGIIDEDGKVVIGKAEKYEPIMDGIKDKNKLLACLKDLVIKKCVDMLKIATCRHTNY